MTIKSIADSSEIKGWHRGNDDFLSFKDIEQQYRVVRTQTLHSWLSEDRYHFRDIVTRVGRNVRVRRSKWEAFLEKRTGLPRQTARRTEASHA